MEPTYGQFTIPRMQAPIMAPRGRPAHKLWILAAYRDFDFDLSAVVVEEDGSLTKIDGVRAEPYAELWHLLEHFQIGRSKWWMIGHRTRYALNAANFLQALDDRILRLPTPRRPTKDHKRAGKFTLSGTCVELDLVCGRTNLKILDWQNFGIDPDASGVPPNDTRIEHVSLLLREYLKACTVTGMPPTKVTAAQQGWAKFRTDHLPAALCFNHDHESRTIERRAYFGGRNEPYRLGEITDTVFSLDIKSCYGDIAKHAALPYYLDREYKAGLDPKDIDPLDTYQWFADCIIETPAADYPVRHHGIPIYPTGRFYTSLPWPELSHALSHGRVSQILRAARYKAAPIMTTYADWYAEARKAIEEAGLHHMKGIVKIAFNASLGYSARQKYTLMPWRIGLPQKWWIGMTEPPDHSSAVVRAHVLDGVAEWLKIGGEPREAMPMIHATICSWARKKLLQVMTVAGRENVYYCDTDGILCNLTGYANLLDCPGMMGDHPGQLSDRTPPAPARIQGQKNYRHGNVVVCAGLIKTRHDRWTEKEILDTPTGHTDSHGNVTPFELDTRLKQHTDNEYENYTIKQG